MFFARVPTISIGYGEYIRRENMTLDAWLTIGVRRQLT